MSTWSSKKECRSFFKSLCAERFAQGLTQNQKNLNEHLKSYLSLQVGRWGAYRALPSETQVEVFQEVTHLEWVFPRMEDRGLEFCKASEFVTGPFGVREPPPTSKKVELGTLRGLLIPGLAFDKNGNRLGKGMGFYDRVLEHFSGLKVGVCFDFQISEQTLPTESHDIGVDFIITESGLLRLRD